MVLKIDGTFGHACAHGMLLEMVVIESGELGVFLGTTKRWKTRIGMRMMVLTTRWRILEILRLLWRIEGLPRRIWMRGMG